MTSRPLLIAPLQKAQVTRQQKAVLRGPTRAAPGPNGPGPAGAARAGREETAHQITIENSIL